MKIQKNDNILDVSERQYRVYFSHLGFTPVEEKEDVTEEEKPLSEMTKKELLEIAEQEGIEVTGKPTNKEIIELIEEKRGE